MTDDLRGEIKAGFKRVDDEFVAVRTEVQRDSRGLTMSSSPFAPKFAPKCRPSVPNEEPR